MSRFFRHWAYGFEESWSAIENHRCVLYHRRRQITRFHTSYRDNDALQYASKGTRDTSRFTTHVAEDRYIQACIRLVQFTSIEPDSEFVPLAGMVSEEHPLYSASSALSLLDTGISYLRGETVPIESLKLPRRETATLFEELKKDGELARLTMGSQLYEITRKGDELVAKKIYACHRGSDGTLVKLDFGQESDGSQRLIRLLPAFLRASAKGSTSVFAIDELDRSLHTLLTRRLLEGYLQSCSPDSRGQLLMTTHDLLLMDQEIFRCDAMWITIASGATDCEYQDVRYTKRSEELRGRLG